MQPESSLIKAMIVFINTFGNKSVRRSQLKWVKVKAIEAVIFRYADALKSTNNIALLSTCSIGPTSNVTAKPVASVRIERINIRIQSTFAACNDVRSSVVRRPTFNMLMAKISKWPRSLIFIASRFSSRTSTSVYANQKHLWD